MADLADPAALAKALEGAEGAFLLSPPNFAAKDFLADRKVFVEKLAEGLKRSKLRTSTRCAASSCDAS